MKSRNKITHFRSPWKYLAALGFLFMLIVVSSSWPLRAEAHVHTFVVNSLGDGGDPWPGDGICDTNPTPSPPRLVSAPCALHWRKSTVSIKAIMTHPIWISIQSASRPGRIMYIVSWG